MPGPVAPRAPGAISADRARRHPAGNGFRGWNSTSRTRVLPPAGAFVSPGPDHCLHGIPSGWSHDAPLAVRRPAHRLRHALASRRSGGAVISGPVFRRPRFSCCVCPRGRTLDGGQPADDRSDRAVLAGRLACFREVPGIPGGPGRVRFLPRRRGRLALGPPCQPPNARPGCATPAARSPDPSSVQRSLPSACGRRCSSSHCAAGPSTRSPAAQPACSRATPSSSAWAH